jgi:hypothetical protein
MFFCSIFPEGCRFSQRDPSARHQALPPEHPLRMGHLHTVYTSHRLLHEKHVSWPHPHPPPNSIGFLLRFFRHVSITGPLIFCADASARRTWPAWRPTTIFPWTLTFTVARTGHRPPLPKQAASTTPSPRWRLIEFLTRTRPVDEIRREPHQEHTYLFRRRWPHKFTQIYSWMQPNLSNVPIFITYYYFFISYKERNFLLGFSLFIHIYIYTIFIFLWIQWYIVYLNCIPLIIYLFLRLYKNYY